MVTAGDFRKGMTVEIDGQVWMVVDFLHREFTYDQLEKICFKNAMRIFA